MVFLYFRSAVIVVYELSCSYAKAVNGSNVRSSRCLAAPRCIATPAPSRFGKTHWEFACFAALWQPFSAQSVCFRPTRIS